MLYHAMYGEPSYTANKKSEHRGQEDGLFHIPIVRIIAHFIAVSL
jgi:hypothetical protein